MSEKNNLLGFRYQLKSISLLLAMQVFVKILVADYPLVEVMFYRSFMGLPLLFVYLYCTGNLQNLAVSRPVVHVLRVIVGGLGMYAAFSAYRYLPLAEAMTILNFAPIFITVLGVVFLGERIHAHRTIALILGFIGMLVIVRPSVDFNWYYAYPLFAALMFAVSTIISHSLTKTDHPTSITVSFSLSIAIITGGISLYYGFRLPFDSKALWFAIIMGNLGTVGQIYNIYAIKHSHASFYAAGRYMRLFGAAILGLVVFAEAITARIVLGMVIIACAGIYISWRERVKNKQKPQHESIGL